MNPMLTMDNQGDGALRDAKAFCEGSLQYAVSVQPAYVANILFGDLSGGRTVSGAATIYSVAHVIQRRAKQEVSRVYTGRSIARMADVKVGGLGAIMQLIGIPVGAHGDAPNAKASIAFRSAAALPQPAPARVRGLQHTQPETLLRGSFSVRAVMPVYITGGLAFDVATALVANLRDWRGAAATALAQLRRSLYTFHADASLLGISHPPTIASGAGTFRYFYYNTLEG
jgi:hypothetical protein